MLKYILNIWILIVLIVGVALSGCSEDMPDNVQESAAIDGPVYIRFNMNLTGDGIPDSELSSSRADDNITGETPGTPRENAINSISLLVYDAATGQLIDIIHLIKFQIDQFISGQTISLNIGANDSQGVNIYAAVNMPDNINNLFTVGQDGNQPIAFKSGLNDYWDVINELVPGSNGKQETLESNSYSGIPMTGQFENTDGSGKTILLKSGTTEDNPLKLNIDLCRLVAKVHVLAYLQKAENTGKAGVEYVSCENQKSEPAERIGWIRLSDVRYIPNGANKSTYIFPQSTGSSTFPKWEDPNMNLDYYLASGKDLGLGFDAPKYVADYSFYDGLETYRETISSDSHLSQAEAYNATTLANTESGNDIDDRYTRGMYCMENYFNISTTFSELFDRYEAPIPMITHVSIAAKMTPRLIIILDNYQTSMTAFVNEFKSGETAFLERHGLSPGDFTDEDVANWEAISAKYNDYFTLDEYKFRSFRVIALDSEADAINIINWSLKFNNLWSNNPDDFENGRYPAGTFYVYDKKYDNRKSTMDLLAHHNYLYLTAGVVAAATGDDINLKTYSVPHLGGWGYYFTYLDQTGETTDFKTPYKASQVTRNTYYLITVQNFGAPGGSITRPEYIKVNTIPVDWDYYGKGDIYLH